MLAVRLQWDWHLGFSAPVEYYVAYMSKMTAVSTHLALQRKEICGYFDIQYVEFLSTASSVVFVDGQCTVHK